MPQPRACKRGAALKTSEGDDWCLLAVHSWTIESAAEEQALQKQAVDLVTAYLTCMPQDEKPLAVEVAVEASLKPHQPLRAAHNPIGLSDEGRQTNL